MLCLQVMLFSFLLLCVISKTFTGFWWTLTRQIPTHCCTESQISKPIPINSLPPQKELWVMISLWPYQHHILMKHRWKALLRVFHHWTSSAQKNRFISRVLLETSSSLMSSAGCRPPSVTFQNRWSHFHIHFTEQSCREGRGTVLD